MRKKLFRCSEREMKEHERAREIGKRLGEMEVLEEKLRINHKIRAYVAFVLTGDENADVQLAADNAKSAMQGLADALVKFLQQDLSFDEARAALDAAKPFLESK